MTEQNRSKNTYRTLFPFFGLLVLIPFILMKTCNKNSTEEKYFNELDLKLTGIIQHIDRPSGFNGFGVIEVKVLRSNRSHIDERGQRTNYYCLLNGDKAELYQLIYDNDMCNVGDTLL